MIDIVNQYFKKFYPPLELIQATEPEAGNPIGISRPVKGYNNVFPMMVCKDGFEMSVQGHCGAYSMPRDDWADEYWMVEIIVFGNENEPLFDQYMCEQTDNWQLYANVPIPVVIQVIEKRGGLKE